MIQLNKLSAALIIARPVLQYGLCPFLEQIYGDHSINGLCSIVTTAASVAPVVIGSGSILVAAYKIPKGAFMRTMAPVLGYKLLPAGLTLLAVQGPVKGHDIPAEAFVKGLTKSSVEILAASAVCQAAGAIDPIAKLAIAMSTTGAINSLFYLSKEGSFENHTKASDYALGFAVARPLYQIAQHPDTHPVVSSALYFFAPIGRGAVLGAIGLGSVMVPGVKSGVVANMIDGAAIATGAFAADHITGPALTIGACLAVTAIYKNQEAIGELLSGNATDATTADEL